MENDAYVLTIMFICFLIGKLIKKTKLNNRCIPPIMGLIGASLGALIYRILGWEGVNNLQTAVGLGLSAGLASTGVHQVYKQLFENEEEEKEDVN